MTVRCRKGINDGPDPCCGECEQPPAASASSPLLAECIELLRDIEKVAHTGNVSDIIRLMNLHGWKLIRRYDTGER